MTLSQVCARMWNYQTTKFLRGGAGALLTPNNEWNSRHALSVE